MLFTMTISVPTEIETDRLTLRSARPGDGPELRRAISSSQREFLPWFPFAREIKDEDTYEAVATLGAEQFAASECYIWRAWEPGGSMVGSVDLHTINLRVPSCCIGYWVRSDRTRRGYAREIVHAAIQVAFNVLNVVRIEARCDERNERSWRFAEALGFRYEGTAHQDDRDADNTLCNSRVYALFPASSAPRTATSPQNPQPVSS